MKKEKEKETRTSIVQVILDDYEHGDTDWRKYPNQGQNDGKRSIRIVQALYDEIGKLLGLDVTHKMIIVGAGNLGQALANYAAFENRGFVLKGLFDVNPRLAGLTIRGVEIRMMDELKDFVKENDIEIGVLTIPKTKAVEVANLLVDNGVKAIWNFAHTDLNLPDNIIVENVHLSESLMRLSYNITRYNEEHEGK